ncbi:DUF559 domain-containing protein [Demequina maris]|uniref:DUF559 domain-containing protein n=1 Tax=Demequina maris TaxID=1638982 RepID=UPI000780D786|nr:DUF559 domain-containing protein [Demequina maris]
MSTSLLPPEIHAAPRSYSRAELTALLGDRRLRTALATGEVRRLLPDRYATVAQSMSFAVRAHAATASTGGIVTGAGALFAWGSDGRAPQRMLVHVRPGLERDCPDWLTLTRAAPRPRAFDCNGVALGDPATAIVHLWRQAGALGARGVTLAALQRGLTSVESLHLTCDALPRLRHRAGLLDTLDAFESGAHSFLEYEGLRRVFVGTDFARLLRQHLVVARGNRYWLDTYDPETRTAIELDGARHHLAGERRERDIRRDADLATLGILTVRLAYKDVMDRPDWCRQTVLAVLADRSARSVVPQSSDER